MITPETRDTARARGRARAIEKTRAELVGVSRHRVRSRDRFRKIQLLGIVPIEYRRSFRQKLAPP